MQGENRFNINKLAPVHKKMVYEHINRYLRLCHYIHREHINKVALTGYSFISYRIHNDQTLSSNKQPLYLIHLPISQTKTAGILSDCH